MVKYKVAHILWPTLYLHECFRLHRMHELQIVVTDVHGISLSVTWLISSLTLYAAYSDILPLFSLLLIQLRDKFWCVLPGIFTFLSRCLHQNFIYFAYFKTVVL